MSQGCALYVPSRDEINRMGLETRDFLDHPNFERYDDLDLETTVEAYDDDSEDLYTLQSAAMDLGAGGRSRVGTRLLVPDGAPRLPGAWKPGQGLPYWGARRGAAWHERTRATVNKLQLKAPHLVCATYVGHGRTGIQFGIDAMVSPFGVKANRAQEEFGDRLCNWAIRNWRWLNLNYVIWWNWMNDGAGWFDYEPIRKRWPLGSQTLVSSRHLDHDHFQVNSPFIAGNE